MTIRRGTVWPWATLIPVPEGWAPLPLNARFAIHYPMGIVALRDHAEPPVVPEDVLDKIENDEQTQYERALGWPPKRPVRT